MFRYTAFISYSHRDRAWGDWLHKALESYRIPRALIGGQGRDGPVPGKLFPVFRDREEMPASADLSTQIQAALAGSATLIVLCSPNAARSRWVNEEVITFKRLGRADRILALVVDGEPNAAEGPEPDRECFPPALRFGLAPDGSLGTTRVEPLAADGRAHGDGRENALLKVIAGVLGVPFDRLKQRELEMARRRARVAQAIAGGMLLLALAAVAGGTLAWLGGIVAQDRLRATQVAQSRAVMEKVQNEPPDVAVPALLSVLPRSVAEAAAQRDRPLVPEAAAQLALTLDRWTDLARIAVHPPEPVQSVRFAGNAPVLLATTGRFPGTVGAYRLAQDAVPFVRTFPEGVMAADISDDGKQVAVTTPPTGAPVALYDIDRGGQAEPADRLWLPVAPGARTTIRSAVQAADGAVAMAFDGTQGNQTLAALDPATGRILDMAPEPCGRFGAGSWLDPTGRIGLVWCNDKSVVAWRLGRKLTRIGELAELRVEQPGYGGSPPPVALSADGKLLAIAAGGSVSFHSTTDGARLGTAEESERRLVGFAFAGAGDELLIAHPSGQWRSVTAAGTGHGFARPLVPGRVENLLRGAVSADGDLLTIVLSSGTLETWRWREDRLVARVERAAAAPLSAMALDDARTGVILGRADGTIEWRDMIDLAVRRSWHADGAVQTIAAGATDAPTSATLQDGGICTLDLAKPDPPHCLKPSAGTVVLQALRATAARLMLQSVQGTLALAGTDGEIVRPLLPPAEVGLDLVRFDHAARSVAVTVRIGYRGAQLLVLDRASGAVRLAANPFPHDQIKGLAFDPADRLIAAYSTAGAAVFSLLGDGRVPVWQSDRPVDALAFTADTLLIGYGDRTSEARALDGWQAPSRYRFEAEHGAFVAVDRAGETLLMRLPGLISGFAVWRPDADAPPRSFEGQAGFLASGDIAADGSMVALLGTGTDPTSIPLLPTQAPEAARTLGTQVEPLVAARFTPDGARLVTATEAGTIAATELASGARVEVACQCGAASDLFVSDAGDRALVVGERAAVLLALPDLRELRRLDVTAHSSPLAAADGRLSLLVLERKPASTVLSVTDGTVVRKVGDPLDFSSLVPWSMLYLSHDGKRLAYLQGRAAYWLDPSEKTPGRDVAFPLGGDVHTAAMDQAGHVLAIATADNRLRVLDLDRAAERFTTTDVGGVQFLVFAGGDDRLLLVHLIDGSTRVFDAQQGAELGNLTLPNGAPALTDIVVAAGTDRIAGLLRNNVRSAQSGAFMIWSATSLLPLKTATLQRPDEAGVKFLAGPNPGIGLVTSDDGNRGFAFREGRLGALLDLRAPDWQAVIDRACARAQRPLSLTERQRLLLTQDTPSWPERWLGALPTFVGRFFLPTQPQRCDKS
jgi:hypothetical protein